MDQQPCAALIKQLNDAIEKNANNHVRSDNLTLTQIALLVTLDRVGQHGMTVRDISQAMHIQQPTATGIVQRLVEKAYVMASNLSEDRRMKVIHLTEAGRDKANVAQQAMTVTENTLLSSLDKEERTTFRHLLEKALKNVRQD